MEPKPAPAPIPTALRLVSLVASRTGLRAVPLILEHYSHPQPFGLVGDVVPGLAMHHLVDLLIRLLAVIGRHPDIPNVPNDNGLDAPCTQRRDKSCSLLVQNILDLPIQPGQLLPFGTKQLPMSPRTTLFLSISLDNLAFSLFW